jgi:hypothetical protein
MASSGFGYDIVLPEAGAAFHLDGALYGVQAVVDGFECSTRLKNLEVDGGLRSGGWRSLW